MILSLFLFVLLPVSGLILGIAAMLTAPRIQNPLTVILLAALSMTLCSFGVRFLSEDDKATLTAVVGVGLCLPAIPFLIGWARVFNIPTPYFGQVRRLGIALTAVPFLALAGAVLGHVAGGVFPDHFRIKVSNVESVNISATRGSWLFIGHLAGFGVGVLIAGALAFTASRSVPSNLIETEERSDHNEQDLAGNGVAMNLDEWENCTDAEQMLAFLAGKVSDRKLRLFACACCRRTASLTDAEWRRMTEHHRHPTEIALMKREAETALRAAQLAEQVADGQADLAQLKALFQSPGDNEMEGCYADGPDAAWAAHASAYRARWCADYYSPASYPQGAGFRSASKTDYEHEKARQCRHLRDIFANSFRPVDADPAWLTAGVVELARTIYDQRAFDRLPELADALKRAGCTHADLLAHLRQPGEHVRGCWAVDLLLGKE